MKTRLSLFVVLLMSAFSLTCCEARACDSGGGDQTAPQVQTAHKDSLQPPTQVIPAPERLKGIVEVSFRIDTEGKVDILGIQSNNPELIKYVVARLESVKFDPKQYAPGKTINYRFSFGKQA